MPINKEIKTQSQEVLSNLLNVSLINKPQRKVAQKLKNFRIDKALCEDFEIYCKMQRKDFTAIITDYIKVCVAENKQSIDDFKNKLSLQ